MRTSIHVPRSHNNEMSKLSKLKNTGDLKWHAYMSYFRERKCELSYVYIGNMKTKPTYISLKKINVELIGLLLLLVIMKVCSFK